MLNVQTHNLLARAKSCMMLLVLVSVGAQAQFILPDTLKRVNQWWTPTLSQLYGIHFDNYQFLLQTATIRLRPGQNFSLDIPTGLFKVTLDSVGVGSFRRSYYTAFWDGDSSDTTFYFSLANWNYGESDPCGNIRNPSLDSISRGGGMNYVFALDSMHVALAVEPIKVTGLGGSVMSHLKVIYYQMPDSAFIALLR